MVNKKQVAFIISLIVIVICILLLIISLIPMLIEYYAFEISSTKDIFQFERLAITVYTYSIALMLLIYITILISYSMIEGTNGMKKYLVCTPNNYLEEKGSSDGQ